MRPGLTVACVLRSGGDFDASWVRALQVGVAEHLPEPHRFLCLSDVPVPCERIPLVRDWKGWWSKLELFALSSEWGRVLYMDLDSLPVGDLSELASYPGDLALIRDLSPARRMLQSGVMAFRAGGPAVELHDRFLESPAAWMRMHRGDGEWLHAYASRPDVLQDLYPGQIVSAKWDVTYRDPKLSAGVRLALGHGRPRFSELAAGWAHALWEKRRAS